MSHKIPTTPSWFRYTSKQGFLTKYYVTQISLSKMNLSKIKA